MESLSSQFSDAVKDYAGNNHHLINNSDNIVLSATIDSLKKRLMNHQNYINELNYLLGHIQSNIITSSSPPKKETFFQDISKNFKTNSNSKKAIKYEDSDDSDDEVKTTKKIKYEEDSDDDVKQKEQKQKGKTKYESDEEESETSSYYDINEEEDKGIDIPKKRKRIA